MGRYAVVDNLTGTVSNIVEWDGVSLYLPPEGTSLVPTDQANLATFGVSVPAMVSNYQARAILIEQGLFATVDAAVQALGKSSIEYQAWEYANDIYRNSPFIASMAAQLGLNDAQVDQLFIAASQIA